MSIYIQLLLVAFIVIFIVDLSGFTDTILDIASKVKGQRVESFRPFTCSLCMTWWCCLVWAICSGHCTLVTIAFSALLAALSFPLSQILIFVREGLNKLIATLEKLMSI